MAETRFQIAGLSVAVTAADEREISDLAPVYRRFPSDTEPHLSIEISRVPGFDRAPGPEYPAFRRVLSTDGRLQVERFDADGEIETGELPLRAWFRVGPSANSLEACVRVAASVALARRRAIYLHASAVENDGGALVFTGVSGAGKSTISSMLDRAPARKLGDELVVLHREGGIWWAYVPPYLGPEGIRHGSRAPLREVHFLVQASHHARTRLPPTTALREVLRHVLIYVAERRTADHVLDIAADLTREIPFYRLEFRKDPGIASVLGIAYPLETPA